MNLWQLFALSVTFWCSNYEVEGQLQKALIFNLTNEILWEKNPNDPLAQCVDCITACPDASNSVFSKQGILDNHASITGHGIFVEHVYENPEGFTYARDIDAYICSLPLIPAIVWDRTVRTGQSFEIGYELFYDEGTINLICSEYIKYVKVEADGSLGDVERQPPNNQLIQSYENNANTTFNIHNESSQSTYYWVKVLSITVYDSGDTRVIQMRKDTINDYSHSDVSITECRSYYSGVGKIQFYENPRNTGSSVLMKTPIVPMRMFHSLSARLTTCGYLNIALVWANIAHGHLKEVDLFLYALYRAWPSQISITFGVSGDLEHNSPYEFGNIFNSEDVLMKLFPAPKVLFRIVDYYYNGQTADAAIIIHNDVGTVPVNNRICTDPQPGWEDITNDPSTSGIPGLTYACKMSQQVANRLNMYRTISPSRFFKLVDNRLATVRNQLASIRNRGNVD